MRVLLLTVVLAAASARADAPTRDARPIDHRHAVAIKVPHGFERDTARERVRQLLAYWHKRFGLTSVWTGDSVFMSGTVLGIDIRALLEVTDSCVQGVANDPGFLWRAPGMNYVERKLRKYLNPNYDEP